MTTVNVTLDDEAKSFELPSSWKEVTVGQFEEIFNLPIEEMTPIDRFAKIFSILTGMDEETILMFPVEDFNQVVGSLKFTTEQIKDDMVDSLIIDGEEYFLRKDFEKLTMGESISIESILDQYDNKVERCISKLLCIFLRKKKENGSLETFKNEMMERESMFKELSISDVYQVFLFFSIGKNI